MARRGDPRPVRRAFRRCEHDALSAGKQTAVQAVPRRDQVFHRNIVNKSWRDDGRLSLCPSRLTRRKPGLKIFGAVFATARLDLVERRSASSSASGASPASTRASIGQPAAAPPTCAPMAVPASIVRPQMSPPIREAAVPRPGQDGRDAGVGTLTPEAGGRLHRSKAAGAVTNPIITAWGAGPKTGARP